MRISPVNPVILLIMGVVILSSCVKEEKIAGCMDITAANYNPDAEESAVCTYTTTTLDIYENGTFFNWNFNDFTFLTCQGSATEVEFDATNLGLALVTDAEGKFFGFFQTINVNEGRYFATPNSKLRFEARLASTSPADTVNVFLRGQEPETVGNCQDLLTSDRRHLLTSSLSNVGSEVMMNIQSFDNIYLQNVGIVAGFEFESSPFDTVMVINSVKWTNF